LAGTRVTAAHTPTLPLREIAAPGGTNTNTGYSARVTGCRNAGHHHELNDTMRSRARSPPAQRSAIVAVPSIFTTSAYPGESTVAVVTSTFLAGSLPPAAPQPSPQAPACRTATTLYQVRPEVMSCSLSGTTLTSVSPRPERSTGRRPRGRSAQSSLCPAGTGAGGYCAAKGATTRDQTSPPVITLHAHRSRVQFTLR